MSDLAKFSSSALFKGGIFASSPEEAASSMMEEVTIGGIGDASWMAHRETSMTDSRMIWSFPISAASKQKGARPITEINKKTNFVAFRGIFLGYNQGFRYSYMDGKNYIQVCQTSRLERVLEDGNVEVYESRNPLEIAIPRQFKSKNDPCTPSYELECLEKAGYTLYGSRPEPGKDTGLMSCSDCVRRGAHMKVLGNTSEPYCKQDGFALFCVFELAAEDPDYDVLSEEPVQLVWRPVSDWGLITVDGDKKSKLDRPFILKIKSLGKSQFQKLGTGEFDRNVITSGAECYLPEGVGSFGQFYDEVKKGQMYVPLTKEVADKTGHALAYPFCVEGYIGELVAEQYMQSHIPVFKINKQAYQEEIGDFVETALSVELFELEQVMDLEDKARKKIMSEEDSSRKRESIKHKPKGDAPSAQQSAALPVPMAEPTKSAAPPAASSPSSISLMDITATTVVEEEEEEDEDEETTPAGTAEAEVNKPANTPAKTKFRAFKSSN